MGLQKTFPLISALWPAVSTVVRTWQCCHHFFSMCVKASYIFFLVAPALALIRQFSSTTHLDLFTISVFEHGADTQTQILQHSQAAEIGVCRE